MTVTLAELELFAAHDQARIEAVVSKATGDPSRAGDAVQEALLGCLTTPPSAPVRNLAAWVAVAAINRARDRARRASAEQRALVRLGPLPYEIHDRVELLDVDLRRALQSLSPQQRNVCTLHYLLDQSVDQVAVTLGITPGTVKTLLHRARRALAAQLKERAH